MKPTIYLSNFASFRTPGHHGPGRLFCIMAKPRHWEKGEGHVVVLTPSREDLENYQSGLINGAMYQKRFLEELEGRDLSPGALLAWVDVSASMKPIAIVVRDGDTLACSCSKEAAAQSKCHRVWIATPLSEAGWRVLLDGKEFQP
jgi:hypothetical protein